MHSIIITYYYTAYVRDDDITEPFIDMGYRSLGAGSG